MIGALTARTVGRMMQADAVEIPVGSASVPRRKAQLQTLESLDARTRAARRANELAAVFAGEMGEAGNSPAGRLAARRAAVLTAVAEDVAARRLGGDAAVSVDDVVRSDGAASRAMRALGIKPGTPAAHVPLRERLAAEALEPGQ